MSDYDETHKTAMADADAYVNAATASATIAPLLALNTAIAVRGLLSAHRPKRGGIGRMDRDVCDECGRYYPCPTATALLEALSAEDPQDEVGR
jgi:hypothetical protein